MEGNALTYLSLKLLQLRFELLRAFLLTLAGLDMGGIELLVQPLAL